MDKNQKLEITHSAVPPEIFQVEISRGNLVNKTHNQTIPVKITFASTLPISAKESITFFANKYAECTVRVIATADNCILTTHAYLKTNSHLRVKNNETPSTTFSDLFLYKEPNVLQPNQQLNIQSKYSKTQDNMSRDSLNASLSSVSFLTTASTVSPMGRNVQLPLKSPDMDLKIQLDSTEGDGVSNPHSMTSGEFGSANRLENSVFPMFPGESSVTEYAVHMNQVRNALETWVYEQVFNCSYYPVLGSYAFATFSTTKKQLGRNPPVATKNVFDVLERICGRSVRRYFTSLDKMPGESTLKAIFSCSVYKQLLDFMGAQGALLSHVEPKYLMGYYDYCAYCKTAKSPSSSNDIRSGIDVVSEVLDNESFKSFSTQCWLDLFLQIFKTLILNPLVGLKDYEGTKRPAQDTGVKKTVYSRAEEILMSWLTLHFNNQRMVVWPDCPPTVRAVSNLDTDLEDGIVLTAVTAAYCPFLVPMYFQNLFLESVTVSQAYHNTICLTLAWKHIRLGFSVSPRDFVRPNTVMMLILVAHLYKTLPSYKPETTVKFKASLNCSETQIVTLENTEESAVTYAIEVLPNNSSFVLDNNCSNNLVLKRGQSVQLSVKYTARSATKVDAILLMCGACMPPKFGRNYVFTLEGTAVKLPVSAVFKLISPLNTVSTTHITINSPHLSTSTKTSEGCVNYDIWITDKEPQPGDLNALCWAKERKRKIPRRLFILSDQFTVELHNRQKSGQLLLQICCFSQATRFYWLIFMNSELGDFFVKLQISPGPPEPSLALTAVVDPSAECSCESERSISCKRTTLVKVPCRNLEQWAAIRTMFELTISPSEKNFWATYIESNIGFRLLQWMLEGKKETLDIEIEQIFKKSKTYNVSCKSPLLLCTPIIEIPNVRSKGYVPVMLHLKKGTKNLTTTIILTSSDGQEVRCYNVNVVTETN